MRPLPKYSLSQENLILTALKSGYHEELQRSLQRFLEQVVAENNQQAAVIYGQSTVRSSRLPFK